MLLEGRFLANRDMDSDLRDLLVWMTRRARRDIPNATTLVRAAQGVGLLVFAKVMSTDPDLVTLNRSLSELGRSMRTLGIRVPLGGRGQGSDRPTFPRRQFPRGSFRSPTNDDDTDDDLSKEDDDG
jgi:hypothetical protein